MSDSSIRRREFIAGATAVTGLAFTSDALAGTQKSLNDLRPADFEKLIGQRFEVDGFDVKENPAKGSLVLNEVVSCANTSDQNRPGGLRPSGFIVRFTGPANLELASATHAMTAGGYPRTGVYLKELTNERTSRQRHFEAVFN